MSQQDALVRKCSHAYFFLKIVHTNRSPSPPPLVYTNAPPPTWTEESPPPRQCPPFEKEESWPRPLAKEWGW